MHVHHVPLVAAARPLDLLDRAKHFLDSASVGEPQGSLRMGPPGPGLIRFPPAKKTRLAAINSLPAGHFEANPGVATRRPQKTQI